MLIQKNIDLPNWNTDLSKGGVKNDIGKPRYDLIAPEFLHGLAEILTFGANKYSERNWEAGMNWGRPFGALMRHMWAWWRGEKLDAETGKSHLYHAACCLMFLSAYEERQIGVDDRKTNLDIQRIVTPEPSEDLPIFKTYPPDMPLGSMMLFDPIPTGTADIDPTGAITYNGSKIARDGSQKDLFDTQAQETIDGADKTKIQAFQHIVTRVDTNDETAIKAYQGKVLLPHFRVLKKRKIYLAGPMRNIPFFNFPAFHDAAATLREFGFTVFNPAENDINSNGSADFVVSNTTGCLDSAIEQGFDLRKALAEDTRFICEEADILALLPGWERSKGAQAERSLAVALGLDVIFLNREYPNFVDQY